ncbi:MAG: hypothetical protein K2W96_14245 [Gemmataceae bacterium]|nr:hypothetical protein [Gemmataceae bacterium]
MPAPDEVYREYVRRIHRTMAAYLSVLAWTRNLDCVAITRNEILRFWGIAKRVEKQRLVWLKNDIKHYFSTVKFLYHSEGSTKFGSLFLARRRFPRSAFAESMTDRKRTQLLMEQGIRASVVPLPSEAEMLAELSEFSHGLASFPLPAAKMPR